MGWAGPEMDLRLSMVRGDANGGGDAEDPCDQLLLQNGLGRARGDQRAILHHDDPIAEHRCKV